MGFSRGEAAAEKNSPPHIGNFKSCSPLPPYFSKIFSFFRLELFEVGFVVLLRAELDEARAKGQALQRKVDEPVTLAKMLADVPKLRAARRGRR